MVLFGGGARPAPDPPHRRAVGFVAILRQRGDEDAVLAADLKEFVRLPRCARGVGAEAAVVTSLLSLSPLGLQLLRSMPAAPDGQARLRASLALAAVKAQSM